MASHGTIHIDIRPVGRLPARLAALEAKAHAAMGIAGLAFADIVASGTWTAIWRLTGWLYLLHSIVLAVRSIRLSRAAEQAS